MKLINNQDDLVPFNKLYLVQSNYYPHAGFYYWDSNEDIFRPINDFPTQKIEYFDAARIVEICDDIE